MLKVANLNVSIGAIAIIRDVSLELGAGEMCGLIGRNGAGKTTLMRALMGALPASGTADLAGADLLRTPPHRRVAYGIGYMPEDRRLVPEFTVEQNILVPSWAVKLSRVNERLDWIFTIMPEVARVRDRRALELSGGQQKLVALARAIARRLAEVLASLKTQAVTVLLSESNEVHVADLLARAYRIERGAVTKA